MHGITGVKGLLKKRMKPSNLHEHGRDGFDGIAAKLTNNGHCFSSERRENVQWGLVSESQRVKNL